MKGDEIDYRALRDNINVQNLTTSWFPDAIMKGGKLWFNCPFHGEKTASCGIRVEGDNAGKFHCFGCGKSGDVVDIGACIWQITNHEAALRLTAGNLPIVKNRREELRKAAALLRARQKKERYAFESTGRELHGLVQQRQRLIQQLGLHKDSEARALDALADVLADIDALKYRLCSFFDRDGFLDRETFFLQARYRCLRFPAFDWHLHRFRVPLKCDRPERRDWTSLEWLPGLMPSADEREAIKRVKDFHSWAGPIVLARLEAEYGPGPI